MAMRMSAEELQSYLDRRITFLREEYEDAVRKSDYSKTAQFGLQLETVERLRAIAFVDDVPTAATQLPLAQPEVASTGYEYAEQPPVQ